MATPEANINGSSPFEFTNRMSIENVPAELRPVIDDAITTYKEVHGDDLIAVYLSGSMARGAMEEGSDADFYAIISKPMGVGVKTARDALFEKQEQRYKQLGLSIIDGTSIAIQELGEERRRKELCATQIDGILVWGVPQDFAFALPKTRAEFVDIYFDFYPDACRDTARLWQEDESKRGKKRRGFAKAQLRALFAITAFQRGADFTATVAEMVEPVQRLAPEVVDLPKKLYEAYRMDEMPDDITRDLERTGLEILELGQRQGFFAGDR